VKGWESHVGNGNGAATYGNVEGGWSPHSPGGRRRASESTLVGGYGEMSALQAQLSGLDIDQDLGAEPIVRIALFSFISFFILTGAET
jgi:hypothetical protein